MMSIRKFLLGFLLWALGFQLCSAQTFAEWFKQGSTQKKYLLEQIAALQVYGGYLQKGYRIAESGWGTVRDITHGEFSLHGVFFDALRTVSPAVRNDARVAEIIDLELSILKAFGGIKNASVHAAYISAVAGAVTTDCLDDLSELLLVISSGKLEMSDEERLKRLDAIAERMRDKAAFAQRFCNQVSLLLNERERVLLDNAAERSWYEIP